ncbi:hypothetical protein [Streptosporangium sp. NPDC000396]|uniref:hypothetical protein n=1 Tax=Streptosporangium sp. NPDC000396 TaxID=3366185 RepID=UPI00368CD330
MLLRLAYLAVTNTFAALRLLPMSDRDKGVEILVLRHQVNVLRRQLGTDIRVRFAAEDRAFLTAFLAPLPREVLRWLRLLVRGYRSALASSPGPSGSTTCRPGSDHRSEPYRQPEHTPTRSARMVLHEYSHAA